MDIWSLMHGDSISGPFEAYPNNPVLTNRNLGGYESQGIGHGDLIQDNEGHWWMLHLFPSNRPMAYLPPSWSRSFLNTGYFWRGWLVYGRT